MKGPSSAVRGYGKVPVGNGIWRKIKVQNLRIGLQEKSRVEAGGSKGINGEVSGVLKNGPSFPHSLQHRDSIT
jgi:hypothetical protein